MKTTKNFWRIVTLALALVMLFSVVACSNNEEPAATSEEGTDAPTTQAPTTEKPTTEKPTTGTTAPTTEPTTGTTAPTTEPTTEGTGTTDGTDDPVTPPVDDLSKPDVWDGTTDKSWFDKDNIQSEYTLTTAAQFAGFIALRKDGYDKLIVADTRYYFENVTIKLGRDIILNVGDSGEDIKALFQLGQVKALTALNSKAVFKGTFDGQGHTISGAFADCLPKNGYQSMFGGLGDNGVIKNLKITNSYFNGTETADKYAGAILVSRAMGTNMLISNVTVENVLLDEGAAGFSGVGILVAKLDEGSSLTIENCHTAGTISFPTKSTNGMGFGGIIGAVESGIAATDTDPAKITTLVLKNCTSSAVIDALEFCGGLVGTIGDLCSVTMDYKCKFTGTITCPGTQGTYVGSNAEAKPEQPTKIDELTVDDFSPLKHPEFDNAIVIEGASCEAGSVKMLVDGKTEDAAQHFFNKDNTTGAAAHGVYKLLTKELYHYYIDFSNVNKSVERDFGADAKIAAVEDCYIRWTFTVTEAGTYTFGSYMRLKDEKDRCCQIQIDDNTPVILHYTLTANEVKSVQDSAEGSYLMWDGVEAELAVGEHTITYTFPAERTAASSWHWRTIYVMKKAA